MSICSISTSWRSNQFSNAKELLQAMTESGLNSLELEFRISENTFNNIKQFYKEMGITITSMHAVCPSPTGRKRGAEAYYISDENEENRQKGAEHVKQTMRNAAEIGAQAVVVHCGRIPFEEPIDRMKCFFDKSKIDSLEAKTFLQEMSYIRKNRVKNNFYALLKSLEEINNEAEKIDIRVGLENRYYFYELPNMNELEFIFNHFGESKFGYWHDTGHACVNEILFGVSHRTMLKTFQDKLIGVHLHDVINGYSDHNEPGSGIVDFDMVKSYLKSETIRVMEINSKVSLARAKKGITFLKEKKIF